MTPILFTAPVVPSARLIWPRKMRLRDRWPARNLRIGRRPQRLRIGRPHDIGRVSMMTSSLSLRWKLDERNSGLEHRQIAEPGILAHVVGRIVLNEAGDGEALAAAELDRGVGAPHRDRRDGDFVERDGALAAELAHLGAHLDADEVVQPAPSGTKSEAPAELLELDRDRVVGARLRDPGNGESRRRKARGSSPIVPRSPSGSARPAR